MMKNGTKFFKVEIKDDFNDLYVCRETTPIPTMEEIIERESLHPDCANYKVVEISIEEFLEEHNKFLAYMSDSANDMAEWSPNIGSLNTWKYWESREEFEE